LLEDLEWLGFEADGGRDPLMRQSDTPAVYEQAIADLRRTHHVYVCGCSRKAIGSERYDNRCRGRALDDLGGRGLRVSLGPETESFTDALLGELTQVPAEQCGDLLVRDRDGHWTYQFAVTVDDFRQGINLVIRGVDLVSSTGRQLALARMLGRSTTPVFLHHPLVRDARGEKLSKSAGDTSVRQLRAAGVSACEVIGSAAALAGLINERRALPASDVCTLFTA
jgi:glutamyl-tRNA synthetase/glutamyl-Q tRNA(Asp) synthetase